MKIFKIGAWACSIVAIFMIAVGIGSLLTGVTCFGIRHTVNYFHAANSILLLAIVCILALQGCRKKQD